ncbi:MAG: VWA domain-containing protein [Candidatus Electronema sp. V4]|uniref:VWA domain-containing protein n=1 Tax=Candidatus Electronema sp. V4 TaxID=3454756 RepID=UPI0040556929
MPSFAQPFWLLAGLLVCGAAVLFLALRSRRRKQELAKFAAPHLLPLLTANVSQTRRRLKNVLFVLGLACLCTALARPQWGSSWIELRRKGIDLLIAVDVSKSMLAPDMKPSRLERAKLAVRDFTAKLDGGDRIGLMPFAGTAFLRFPLTTDYDAFNTALDSLSTETVPNGGTSIGQVIEDAVRFLAGESNHKILILLTDGEDLDKNALPAAALAAREKMLIYTVGVGTPQGELIPLPTGGFVQDENGAFVTSRLDEQTLTAVAEATGGSYTPLGSMGEGLDSVYERKLALLPKNEQVPRKKRLPVERFQWPLAAAVLLFSADFLLIGRRRRLRLPLIFTAGRRKKKQQEAAAVLLLCLFAALPARADQGGDLYRSGRHAEAAAWYQQELAKDSGNPVLHFNLGASLHQQGQHAEAAAAFTKALRSDDVELQGKSYFNRGISLHHAGAKEEQAGALPQAVEHLKQAEQSFAAAASLLPEAAKKEKAARSQRIVKAKREQLEKRLQEQKQQKPDSGNKEEKKQQEQPSGSEERQQKEQNQDSSGEKKPPSSGDEKEQNKPDKKQQEGKPPAVPQPDSGDKKTDGQAGKKQPQAPSEQGETPPAGEQNSKEERIMGRMTQEEARILLDSLKGEQGELNFIPQEAADPTGGKDW